MRNVVATSLLLSSLLTCNDAVAQEKPATLVFSVRTWTGDYYSKDIYGGVEMTPIRGAIYTVRADGKNLKKIVEPSKNTDYPTFSSDAKWVYFQSNATGRSHVYRSKPDGTGGINLTDGDRLGKQWKDSYGYSLSVDGKKMLFTVHDGSSSRVAFANADGSEPRLLAPHLAYMAH